MWNVWVHFWSFSDDVSLGSPRDLIDFFFNRKLWIWTVCELKKHYYLSFDQIDWGPKSTPIPGPRMRFDLKHFCQNGKPRHGELLMRKLSQKRPESSTRTQFLPASSPSTVPPGLVGVLCRSTAAGPSSELRAVEKRGGSGMGTCCGIVFCFF